MLNLVCQLDCPQLQSATAELLVSCIKQPPETQGAQTAATGADAKQGQEEHREKAAVELLLNQILEAWPQKQNRGNQEQAEMSNAYAMLVGKQNSGQALQSAVNLHIDWSRTFDGTSEVE